VLVFGCGGLGQFALQYLRLLHPGADLFVAVRELDASRLERASELGADIGLLDGDAAMTLQALGGHPADVVLDFVGTDATLAHASAVVAQGGLVQLVGEAGGSMRFGFDDPPVESWLTTVAWGSHQDLRDVVGFARRGRLSWNVEHVPLREAQSAHARLRAGEAEARIVLVP
jgi:alcohol dehydrogenase, propanol-preferring